MSIFYNYFKNILRWPPLSSGVGAIAVIVAGIARSFDSARENILWLREQFHPATAEDEYIKAFGESRGIFQFPTEKFEPYKKRVIAAYNWQYKGGKEQGLPEILAYYGYRAQPPINMRTVDEKRWAEFAMSVILPPEGEGFSEADYELIPKVINDQKPARSKLSKLNMVNEVSGKIYASAATIIGETITVYPENV